MPIVWDGAPTPWLGARCMQMYFRTLFRSVGQDEVGGAAASNFRSLDLAPPLSLADRGNVCYFVSMSDAVCEFFRFEFRAYRLVRPWSA